MIDKEWNDCDQVNSHLFFYFLLICAMFHKSSSKQIDLMFDLGSNTLTV